MVLLFSVENPTQQKAAKGSAPFVWSTFEDRVAVLYHEQSGEQPTAAEIEAALDVVQYPVSPAFFVTPYNGVIEDGSDDVESTALQWIFDDVTQCVQRRENVTIVHRGANAEAHLEPLLIAFLSAVRSSAEYGMQVVADESAKEKQMQRLLQMSITAPADTVDSGAGGRAVAQEAPQSREDAVHLSKELRRRIGKLRQEYHYVHPADRRASAAAVDSRYGVITAAHDELLEPPAHDAYSLTPETFVACPPVQRVSRSSRVPSYTAAKSTRSHTVLFNQMQRRNTALLLADLNKVDGEGDCEPIAGNGWGDTITTYAFDGSASVMALPGVPNFDELVREFAVDFWVRTDLKPADGKRVLLQIMEGQREETGQLFQISLNWYEDMPDSLRVVIRDSANRVLEAVASVARTGMTSGDAFHHVVLRVGSLEEGQLACEVDAKAVDVQLMQQEHPIAFNPWPHRLFVGGFLNEENTPTMVFRGTIAELRFRSGGEPPRPVVRWPLLASDSATLPEMTRTIPADHRETLLALRAVEEPAPRSAPSFDGNLVMNVGTLPLFGQLMHNWRMEFRFRTDVTSRVMTLVGVTDGRFKMQELGIVLNAEPVATKERFRYHELHTTFYIVDAFGLCCSALLRGTEHHNLMDGEWHTLVWRCIDSEANKFTVKVDDVLQDLLFVSREGPTRYVTFENWIAVGGHNVRNWKVQRPFIGQIGRFYLSLRGTPYVTLQMNEGPGAHVLQDRSNHSNHGLLINSATNAVRRNDVVWVPAPSDQTDERGKTNARDVRIFKNNSVAIAAVVFTCSFGDKGVARESIYDIYTKRFHELTSMPHYLAEATESQWRSWYGLPEECYHALDSITRLEESINAVLSADAPRGHLMVTLRIGDCRASVLHFRDPEMPDDATYDCNMLKWRYPYMVEGTQGRRELMLNRMVEGAEAVLLSDTLKPYVTARLGPVNARNKTVLTDDIVRGLQNGGRPWFLPVVLHSHLLNAEFGSSLHIIHRVFPRMTADVAAAVSLFNKKLIDGVRENASLLIQRNWRGHMANREARQQGAQRGQNDRKVEEIRSLRMKPVVQAKHQLAALLITLHHPQCPGVPPIENDSRYLEEALQQQGYAVTVLEDPDAAAIVKAVAQLDATKSNVVYVSGYGGAMNLRQPPVFGFEALAISIEEQAGRTTLECDASAASLQLLALMRAEAELLPAKAKKGGKGQKGSATATRPKKQSDDEAELERRQMETAMRSHRQQLEQDESYSRDALVRSYEDMNQQLARELRQAVVATREYEQRYRAKGPEGDPQNFIYPVESSCIDPFASACVDVEDLLRLALHRQAPPLGLQCVVAVDLQPVTPFACGLACVASSTGNTLRIPYGPQQRNLLTPILVKAFSGQMPKVAAGSKYTVLSGGIETADNQRDWKSLAAFVVAKMQPYCAPARFRMLRAELDRQLPFVAELIPVRDVVVSVEAKERRRREEETQKVKAVASFGVGSSKVQSDMFSLFRGLMDGITINELAFTNTIRFLFLRHSAGIDGVDCEALTSELEKCRPAGCGMALHLAVLAGGVEVRFDCSEPADRLHLTQWLNAVVMRSLTWQFPLRPLYGSAPLELDYVEYVYDVRISCSLRRYYQLRKQLDATPIPQQYLRSLGTRVVK